MLAPSSWPCLWPPAAKDDGKNNADAPADSLALLTKVWDSYTDDEKFPAAGGDYETSVDDAPGAFDPSNADNLNFLLTVPTEDASLIDDAASLSHMMNANTFTCGALRVKNGDDAAKLAERPARRHPEQAVDVRLPRQAGHRHAGQLCRLRLR